MGVMCPLAPLGGLGLATVRAPSQPLLGIFPKDVLAHAFQFGVVQSVNFDAFCNAVSVRAVHQFQPIIQQIVTAQKFTAHPDWPTGRRDINRKIFLDFIYDFKCFAAFAVHFVTKGQNRQIAQAANLKQFAGLAFDAARRQSPSRPHPQPSGVR